MNSTNLLDLCRALGLLLTCLYFDLLSWVRDARTDARTPAGRALLCCNLTQLALDYRSVLWFVGDQLVGLPEEPWV